MKIAGALASLALLSSPSGAEPPCEHAILDPVVTALRDARLDLQRGACMRQTLSADVGGAVLIDTPGFHGQLGGALVLGGSVVVAKAHELSAELTVIDTTFVQNAVNKVTHAGFGPLVVGAAAGKPIGTGAVAALSLRAEVPSTRDNTDTMHTGAQLAAVVSGALAQSVILHGRLAALGALAVSDGGTTQQLAFVAGVDPAFHVRRTLGADLGSDLMAGWKHGLDDVLVRLGVHWRPGDGRVRVRFGGGVPVGGSERTNVILDLAVLVDR